MMMSRKGRLRQTKGGGQNQQAAGVRDRTVRGKRRS